MILGSWVYTRCFEGIISFNSIPEKDLQGVCYHPHFSEEETEAQRTGTSLGSHSREVANLGLAGVPIFPTG